MNIFIHSALKNYYSNFPVNFVDVGASDGIPPEWEQARPFLHVIAFEPDKRAFDELMKRHSTDTTYFNTALYEKPTTLEFNLARKQQTSSIFLPNFTYLNHFPDPERYEILNTVSMPADTLDNLLLAEGIEDIDFIKLDTQGSELAILKGANQFLNGTLFGVHVEVEFVPLYQEQPLFAEVDAFLRDFDLALFGIVPCYWKRSAGKISQKYVNSKGQLIFGDAIYFKTARKYCEIVQQTTNREWQEAKILKAATIALLYEHADYALELCQYATAQGILSARNMALITDTFNHYKPWSHRIPSFRGRGRIAKFFYRLYKLLRPSSYGWAGCNEFGL